MKRLFTRQGLSLIFEYTVTTVVGTVLMFLALRHYSPQEMGVLAKVQAEIGILSVLLTLCLDTPLLNRLAEHGARGRLLGATLLLRAGSVLVTLGLALCFSMMAGQAPRDALPWLVVVLIPQALSALNVFGIMLYYDNALKWVPKARTGVALLFSGIRLLALWQSVSLMSYTLLAVAEGAIGLALTWWCYRRHGYDIKIRPCFTTAKALLVEAAPLILSSFIVTCFFKLDLLLVAGQVTASQLAEYSVAQRIVECYMVVIMILLNQYYVWLTGQDHATKMHGIAYMTRAGFGLVALVAFVHFAAIQPLLLHFFKGKYALGIHLSGFLVVSLLFNVIGSVRGYLFVFEGLNKWHIPSAIMGIIVLVGGTVVATRMYGLYGAAAVLIAGQAVSVFGSTYVLRPLRKYHRLLLGLNAGAPA